MGPVTFQPQPEPTRPPLPLYLGGDRPLVAYRIWRIIADPQPPTRDGAPHGLRLASVGKPTIWPARQAMHAACWRDVPAVAHTPALANTVFHAQGEHRAPWPDGGCQCGVWGFKDLVIPQAVLYVYANRGYGVALGAIKMWGRVVEHEHGWRSEYAYPFELEVFHGEQLEALSWLIADSNVRFIGGNGNVHSDPVPTALDVRLTREAYHDLAEQADELAYAYGIPVRARPVPPPMPSDREIAARQATHLISPQHATVMLAPMQPDEVSRTAAIGEVAAWVLLLINGYFAVETFGTLRGWFSLACSIVAVVAIVKLSQIRNGLR